MKALKSHAAGSLIAISVAALICIANFAYAQSYRGSKVGNVILVHGAWADGSSWKEVIPRLEARGINVVAVQLPLSSLATDVATVQRAIAIAPSPVILVGHSYGGVVITEAGNDPNVIGLVYVAAFAPDAGESTMTLNALYPPSPVVADHLIVPDAEGYLKVLPEGILTDFAEDLPVAEKTTLIATQGPITATALDTPISTAAWRTKPSWFIIAERDRIIQPKLEEFEAQRMHAVASVADSCHVIMLSKPEHVTDVISGAIRSLGK